jgi:integral membrane sensor domain MASE1
LGVNALLVFFVMPILIGVGCELLVRTMRGASLAAAIIGPVVVVVCIMAFDPEDAWNWIAALLVSPLIVAIAVTTVMLCHRRPTAYKRKALNGG